MPRKFKEDNKKYYERNKEILLKQSRDRYYRDKEQHQLWQKEYHKRNPATRLLCSARRNAKLKNIDFSITKEDLTFPEFCPYLNCKLTYNGGREWSSGSLDRIDNSKGYIKGNVQIISSLANTMKSYATIEQMLVFAENVIKIHG